MSGRDFMLSPATTDKNMPEGVSAWSPCRPTWLRAKIRSSVKGVSGGPQNIIMARMRGMQIYSPEILEELKAAMVSKKDI